MGMLNRDSSIPMVPRIRSNASDSNSVIKQRPTFQIRLSDLNHMPDIQYMDTMRNVPKSQILQETATTRTDHMNDEEHEKTIRDVKKRAYLLYNKYIREGAEFEINIAYQTRHKMTMQLGDKQKLLDDKEMRLSHLVDMYQQPKMDMKQLLQYSLTRLR